MCHIRGRVTRPITYRVMSKLYFNWIGFFLCLLVHRKSLHLFFVLMLQLTATSAPVTHPTYPQCLCVLWSAADFSHPCSLGVRLLCRQTPGNDQCSLSRSLVMRCAEPLGATPIPYSPFRRRSQPHLQLNRPPLRYTHPPLDLEQSSRIQTSSLTLCTQSPRRCRGETRKDCFLIAGRRKKGEGFWNI